MQGPGVWTGLASARCHHGELLQGVFRDAGGHVHRALVTLPLPGHRVQAEFRIDHSGRFTVTPDDRTKALTAARATVAVCTARGVAHRGGHLRIDDDLPVGAGMGSSTSDTVAAIRAVSACLGVALPPQRVAELAVRAEGACDPVMLDDGPRLFAQRRGETLEVFGPALPPLAVLGCRTGDGAPVDTLGLGGPPREADVTAYERLRRLLRRAVRAGDAGLLGHVSTASARLNQRLLPKSELPELERIAARVGAVGVQIAHSGNVAGLVFDAADPHADSRIARATRLLHHSGIPTTETFRPTAVRSIRRRSAAPFR